MQILFNELFWGDGEGRGGTRTYYFKTGKADVQLTEYSWIRLLQQLQSFSLSMDHFTASAMCQWQHFVENKNFPPPPFMTIAMYTYFGSLYCKQYEPRSDSSFHSVFASMVKVYWSAYEYKCRRRKKQT